MMVDRTSYMLGYLAGLTPEDLSLMKDLVAVEQSRRAAMLVRQPPAPSTPIEANKPLPVVGLKEQPIYFTPSKKSAAIRITDDTFVAENHWEDFGKHVRELLRNLKVKRLLKENNETVEKDVDFEFYYVYKSRKNAAENRALIVFPYGCIDFCKVALPTIKHEFPSAEIYTGSTQRGKWEY